MELFQGCIILNLENKIDFWGNEFVGLTILCFTFLYFDLRNLVSFTLPFQL